jgi:prepilin-type N-terminal cleavage/methylation domain-containing protein
MNPASPIVRRAGFTLVELLLAIVLGVLVAGILAALIHGLLSAGSGQSARIQGPVAARAAIRTLSREIACAFAPPIQDLAPLRLSTSTESGQPEVVLAFYAPVPATEPAFAQDYDIAQITYEVRQTGPGRRMLQRISSACSGPLTNAPTTNVVLSGRFELALEVITNGEAHVEWPLPASEKPTLPTSLRLSLAMPGEPLLQTEVLIQSATGIRSPRERKSEEPAEE